MRGSFLDKQVTMMRWAKLVFLLVVCSCASLPAEEFQNIRWPEASPTAALFRQKSLAFHSEQIELYRQHSTDADPKVRALAEEFLKVAIASDVTDWKSSEPELLRFDELPALNAAAYKAGARDALVEMHAVNAMLNEGRPSTAVAIARRALKSLAASDYPQGLKLLILDRLLQAQLRAAQWSSMAKTRDEISESLPAWFLYASTFPDGPRIALQQYMVTTDRMRQSVESMTKDLEACKETAGLDPWILAMLQGLFHYRLAWDARGTGYASTVTPEGWEIFQNEIASANEAFLTAHQIQPKFPDAAFYLMAISKVDRPGEKSLQDWYEAAIEAEIDYSPVYSEALSSMLPRWGGTVQQMANFGVMCANCPRTESNVPIYLLDALSRIHEEGISWEQLFASPRIRDEVQKVIAQISVAPEHQTESKRSRVENSCRVWEIAAAHYTGDHDTAIQLYEKAAEQLAPNAMARVGIDRPIDLDRIYALREFGDRIDAIESRMTAEATNPELWTKIRLSFEALLDDAKSPRATAYLDSQIKLANTAIDYAEGRWTSLSYDHELSHWNANHWSGYGGAGNHEHFRVEDPDRLIASTETVTGKAMLTHRLLFPGPKEIDMEIIVEHKSNSRGRAGVELGSCYGGKGGRFFSLDPGQKRVDVYSFGVVCHHFKTETKPSRLGIRAWGPHQWEIGIDGEWFNDGPDPEFDPATENLSIGIPFLVPVSATVAINGLKIRRLTGSPPDGLVEKIED